jgi:hypothetical protein
MRGPSWVSTVQRESLAASEAAASKLVVAGSDASQEKGPEHSTPDEADRQVMFHQPPYDG